jgi:hypothetical protein
MKTLRPFTVEELSMDHGADGTYPFTEGESAEITGYGHQDKAEFAAGINLYDERMSGEPGEWTADDIEHRWAVRVSEELCSTSIPHPEGREPVTATTPGAFPITTLWGAR